MSRHTLKGFCGTALTFMDLPRMGREFSLCKKTRISQLLSKMHKHVGTNNCFEKNEVRSRVGV